MPRCCGYVALLNLLYGMPDRSDSPISSTSPMTMLLNGHMGMAQAAANADMHLREISFKHTVQIWGEWTTQCRHSDTTQNAATLFRLIAQIKVNQRPGR